MSDPCAHGHVWTHQFSDDWIPERGRPCDCGKKLWGVPVNEVREHDWQFYMNGTFCRRCGARLGDQTPCR